MNRDDDETLSLWLSYDRSEITESGHEDTGD